MKATGIVRRIDDLGRVVIPKEIRRTQHIRMGDPLEIFTNSQGEVIFKKYSPIEELNPFATQYAEVLAKNSGFPVMITDRDRVIAISGGVKKELLEMRVTADMEKIMESRKLCDGNNEIIKKGARVCDGCEYTIAVSSPIITHGDIIGSVSMLNKDDNHMAGECENKLVNVASMFFSKQMEE